MTAPTPEEKRIATPDQAIPRWIVLTFLALGLLGLGDSSYLFVKHLLGLPVTCTIIEGCGKVLSSSYAAVFGIPVALLGLLYYASIFFLAIACLASRRAVFFRIAVILTAFGFLASLWFVYLQLFIIHAICLYCMFSAAATTVLFALGLYAARSGPPQDDV